jgi:hypothetical protein
LSGVIVALGILGCAVDSADGGAEEGTDQGAQALVSYWTNYYGGGGGDAFESPANFNMKLYAARLRCGYYVDQIYLRGEQAFAFGPYGGNGGSLSSVQCSSGKLAGVKGRAGAWIDQLTFVCRRDDGSTYDLPTCGTSTGGSYFEAICGSGTSMVAVKGRAGAWLDGISIGCGWSDLTP